MTGSRPQSCFVATRGSAHHSMPAQSPPRGLSGSLASIPSFPLGGRGTSSVRQPGAGCGDARHSRVVPFVTIPGTAGRAWRLVEEIHQNGVRLRLANATVEGVFHRQPVVGVGAFIDLEDEDVLLGIRSADRAAAEPAHAACRSPTNPALQPTYAAPSIPWPRRVATFSNSSS